MAATPFKVVTWSPLDPVKNEKLDAMVSNDNWLKENMVRGRYRGYRVRRSEGIRIAAGLALITSRKEHRAQTFVEFGDFFSQGCKPIVTTGIVSKGQRKIWVTVDGPGDTMHPTNNGFQVHVVVDAEFDKNLQIKRNFYVSWHAIGY